MEPEIESQIIGCDVEQWRITAHLIRMVGGGSGDGTAGVCIHDTEGTADGCISSYMSTSRGVNHWSVGAFGKCLPIVEGARHYFLPLLCGSNMDLKDRVGISFDVGFTFDEMTSACEDSSVVDIALKSVSVDPGVLVRPSNVDEETFDGFCGLHYPGACNGVMLGHFIEKLRWE